MYENTKAEGIAPHPRALPPSAFCLTLTPETLPLCFGYHLQLHTMFSSTKLSQSLHSDSSEAAISPCTALYTQWGFENQGILFLKTFCDFSLARLHSLLWNRNVPYCHPKSSQTQQVDEIRHGNTPMGGTFCPLKGLSGQREDQFHMSQQFQAQPLLPYERDSFLFMLKAMPALISILTLSNIHCKTGAVS